MKVDLQIEILVRIELESCSNATERAAYLIIFCCALIRMNDVGSDVVIAVPPLQIVHWDRSVLSPLSFSLAWSRCQRPP